MRCRQMILEGEMDTQTKREIAVLTLTTLAAVPLVGSLAFVVAAGLLAW